MKYYGRILLVFFCLLAVSMVALAAWLIIRRTDHGLSGALSTAAFSFVIGFVSILLLRVLFFAVFTILQLFLYRKRTTISWLRRTYQPLVSIIVPAYNEEKVIENALLSHLGVDYPNIEIIVVDDGSSDETVARAEAFAANRGDGRIRVFSIANAGKGHALNHGIARAEGKFLLCVDADSRLDPDSIGYAIRHFDDPRVGAVAGNVKVLNRKGFLPNLQALEYIIGQNLMRRPFGLFGVVNIVPGPFGLFRREALKSAGYYEDDTFAEDCDITLKILARGWKVVDEMNAVVRTEAPSGLVPFIRQRYRWTRGTLQSMGKHRHEFLRNGFGMWLVLSNMTFDAIIWPLFNLIAHACVFYLILDFGLVTYLVFWWIHFTLLDMALALLCVAGERESVRLVLYVLVYRIFFLVVMDVCKLLASIEELLNVRMGWGKIQRTGSGAVST